MSSTWSLQQAENIAKEKGIILTEEHILLVINLRDFYQKFAHIPIMRNWLKWISQTLSPEKADSLYLMKLFGERPLKLVCELGGLPLPRHCL